MEADRTVTLRPEALGTRVLPQLPREHRSGAPAGLDAPRPTPLERVATAGDASVWPEAADAAAATARPADVADAQLEPLRVAVRDRQASYREFGPRFVSGLIAAALLAGLVALVAWLR